MKSLLKSLSFIPFINRLYNRKYYATGIGIYLINSFYKRILGINRQGDFLLNFTSRANSPKKIIILKGTDSSSVYLSLATSGGCYYQAINGIEFGEGTIWSNNCSFISANHSFTDLKKHNKVNKIKIGKNVWLGSNCVVLPEVSIGDYSILGAGSVVTKSIESYTISVGNPAKVVARRCKKCLNKVSLSTKTDNCNNCSI
ncbi:MAG: capsule biosynthesis protein CapJ [Flavobacterium sp.]|nr:MAG: capsule biosynthesis protein CapJ [Flavobacterium sp.]